MLAYNRIKLDSGSYMVLCTRTESFSPLIFETEPMDDLWGHHFPNHLLNNQASIHIPNQFPWNFPLNRVRSVPLYPRPFTTNRCPLCG